MGGGPPYLELFVEETSFYNRIVLGTIFPNFSLDPFPHILQTWLRNCVGGFLIYFFSGFLWCFYIYYWKRNVYVPKGVGLFLLSFSVCSLLCFLLLLSQLLHQWVLILVIWVLLFPLLLCCLTFWSLSISLIIQQICVSFRRIWIWFSFY